MTEERLKCGSRSIEMIQHEAEKKAAENKWLDYLMLKPKRDTYHTSSKAAEKVERTQDQKEGVEHGRTLSSGHGMPRKKWWEGGRAGLVGKAPVPRALVRLTIISKLWGHLSIPALMNKMGSNWGRLTSASDFHTHVYMCACANTYHTQTYLTYTWTHEGTQIQHLQNPKKPKSLSMMDVWGNV